MYNDTVYYTDKADLNSSLVKQAYFNSNEGTLTVVLGDYVYEYDGVPRNVYDRLTAADSAGHYYNTKVKPEFGPAESLGYKSYVHFEEDEQYEDDEDEDYEDWDSGDDGDAYDNPYIPFRGASVTRLPSWRETAVAAVKAERTPQVALSGRVDVTKAETREPERQAATPTPQVRLNRESVPVNGAPKYTVSVRYELTPGKSEKFTTKDHDVTGAVQQLSDLLHTLGLEGVAKEATIYFE